MMWVNVITSIINPYNFFDLIMYMNYNTKNLINYANKRFLEYTWQNWLPIKAQ